MEKIRVVVIEKDSIPRPTYIDNNLIALSKDVNIDRYGNQCDDFEAFSIVEIKDNVNIISSPNGEQKGLPVIRIVGQYTKLYGKVYIVKMEGYDLISLTEREALEYCVAFSTERVSLSDLGLHIDEDDGYRRIEITCDEW